MTEPYTQLMHAAQHGDHQEVARLIPLTPGVYDKSFALCEAAANGHAQCVKLLIPASNPTLDQSNALWKASGNGHAQCVQLLIPVSDPKANNSVALYTAVKNNHVECVKLLIPVSNCKEVCTTLQEFRQYKELSFFQQCITEREHSIITDQLNDKPSPSRSIKKM